MQAPSQSVKAAVSAARERPSIKQVSCIVYMIAAGHTLMVLLGGLAVIER